MASIFTRIIKGEIPCHKVLEDSQYLAFLDIRPIAPGHTLVVPKVEVDYIFDLDPEQLAGLMEFSRQAAAKIKKVVACQRIGIMVAGLEVPHAHVHLVPMVSTGDLTFAKAKPAAPEELAAIARKIRDAKP